MQAQRRRFRLIFSFVPAVAIALFLGLSGVAAEQTANVGVQMGDNFFNPASTTVNVGDTVTWTNVGNRPHDVTSTDGGPLNSPRRIMNGGTYSYTATTAGTYQYECTIHPGMDGTLVVQAASTGGTGGTGGASPNMPRTGGGGMAAPTLSPWLTLALLGIVGAAGGAGVIARRRRAA